MKPQKSTKIAKTTRLITFLTLSWHKCRCHIYSGSVLLDYLPLGTNSTQSSVKIPSESMNMFTRFKACWLRQDQQPPGSILRVTWMCVQHFNPHTACTLCAWGEELWGSLWVIWWEIGAKNNSCALISGTGERGKCFRVRKRRMWFNSPAGQQPGPVMSHQVGVVMATGEMNDR